MELLFKNFRLLTLSDRDSYGVVDDSTIWVADGKIKWIGRDAERPYDLSYMESINGHGQFLSPGLIDCHTHLVYGGSRADEWEMRLNGVEYEEIARRGGGILSTVSATRAATEDQLYVSAAARLKNLMKQGVTAVEIKTGYGLDLDSELKMLRVINRLKQNFPIHISRTLLAAHAVPPEYSGQADAYIDLICDQIIPAAKDDCDAVDAFCESIAFSAEQVRRMFQATQAANDQLGLKIHAEQLTDQRGAVMAAEMNAMSADHLEYLAPGDCDELARAGVVATLLPGAFYNLKESQRPPVDALRSSGVEMAIATDANPGSSPVSSILLMAHMACTFFQLTPLEAIRGLTVNAAKALRLDDQMGHLAVGMNADFAVWNIATPAELAYGIGHNPCTATYVRGHRV